MDIEAQLTLFNQKLDEVTAGLTPQYIGRSKNKVSKDNALAISLYTIIQG